MFENLDQNSLSSAADPKELIIFSAFYSQVQKTEWVSDAKTFLFSCRRPNWSNIGNRDHDTWVATVFTSVIKSTWAIRIW
jgi:hypothetical protein